MTNEEFHKLDKLYARFIRARKLRDIAKSGELDILYTAQGCSINLGEDDDLYNKIVNDINKEYDEVCCEIMSDCARSGEQYENKIHLV